MKNIVLCGFMGSGKTSVGKALAELLNRKFVDMDDYIEAREKMKIPDIFESFGEAHFRECEQAAVLELSKSDSLIIASGGGALTNPENAEALRKNGVIVFLNARFADCYGRIEKTDRPLVKKNGRDALEQLYNERAAVYRHAADIEIDAAGSVEKIAETIRFKLAGKIS